MVDARGRLEAALLAAMARAATTEMVWGRDDCALWVAGVLRQALGYDPARRWRGRYWSRGGARRLLGKGGMEDALAEAAGRHGWREIDPADARVGDVALARANQMARPVTMVCRAPGWFVGRDSVGFAAVRTAKIIKAWAVV